MSYKKEKACISSRENAHNDTDRQVSTAYYCVKEELDAEHHEALATSPACQSDKGWGVRKGVFQSELIYAFLACHYLANRRRSSFHNDL